MKHIICGGFDYAIPYEMDQNAIMKGVDYFIDIDSRIIGTSYLGKPIKPLETLYEEKSEDILILIGSIVHKTEWEMRLMAMGFKENLNYVWGIAFIGDEKCPRLWKHIEWSDKENNADGLKMIEESEFCLQRLKVASAMVEWDRFDTVVDLGAANERLRNFLPKQIKYVPVDYMKYSEETILCDVNRYEFPPQKYSGKRTCFFSIGNIQYCHDWRWYLEQIAEYCDCVILEHNDFVRVSREYRRTHWTYNNALFDYEIICYMQELGFALSDARDFRLSSVIFKFERK